MLHVRSISKDNTGKAALLIHGVTSDGASESVQQKCCQVIQLALVMHLLLGEVGYFDQCETETLAIDTNWTSLNISWYFSDEDPVRCCHWNDMSYPAKIWTSEFTFLSGEDPVRCYH